MLSQAKISFIGGGAMAEALLSGLLKTGLVAPDQICVADINVDRLAALEKKFQITTNVNSRQAAEKSDILFLTVKPQVVETVFKTLQSAVKPETLVVSIVAGLTLERLEAAFAQNSVIRVMPNTPLAVGQGMAAIAVGSKATEEQAQDVLTIFQSAGKAVRVAEKDLDAVTGLSGSGPAYAFLMVDALADAGVRVGLPRAMSITLAAQTLLGAAKMVLETGEHPAQLRDMVTSPGGTAIAGVHALERGGVRVALIDAVMAATKRSKDLGKKHE
jgi:pyrroline-5-carboxylate reductase